MHLLAMNPHVYGILHWKTVTKMLVTPHVNVTIPVTKATLLWIRTGVINRIKIRTEIFAQVRVGM